MIDVGEYRETRLLTVATAARIIGLEGEVGRRHVRRLIRAGKIRGEDHGTGLAPRWLIPATALRDYLISVGRIPPDDAIIQ